MQTSDVDSRRIVGGELCLDFANSVDWSGDGTERPAHTDVLRTPDGLERWGRRLGLVAPQVQLLMTGRELKAGQRLRSALHRVFSAIIDGDHPAGEDLDTLTQTYREATSAAALLLCDGRWTLEWAPDDPRRIRYSVVASAIDLLRDTDRLRRVRRCPGGNCGWLFVDTSGRRRWCSMEVCGSRAKMRALYERRRQETTRNR